MGPQHDEMCIGALKVYMCDCDFIAKIRENQVLRDINILQNTATKGGNGKWFLKTKAMNNLWNGFYKTGKDL